MATVYLAGNEKITVFGPARVYGSAGRETVLISEDARNVFLSPAVERADLAGRAGDYQFRGAAGRLEIWRDDELVASVPAGAELRFADGGATVSVNPETGDVSLGGRILGTTPEPVDIPLDPARPSDPAVNPVPTPDPDPDPTPDPDPDPEPDPKPDPAPTPDPWDDPWPWPADKDTLTIRDVKRGADGRTLDDRRGGKDTTFDLVGAPAGDTLSDLTITDDSTTDNDILKIRGDQAPAKVENVENVEVVGDDPDAKFDAANFTGLKKITVSRSDSAGDGKFEITNAGGAMTIVAGDKVTELNVHGNLADSATIDDRRGGKDTTFDLAGVAWDNLYDYLAITDDSTTDNDILKIRGDQRTMKVVNVEHVEVVGAGGSDPDSEVGQLDASDWTGLRKITVSNRADGQFVIKNPGGAMTIVAGDNVTALDVDNLADGATLEAGADVKEIQLFDGSNAAVRCTGDMVEIHDYLAGTLTVSGSSATVYVSADNGGIIDAAGLSGALTVNGQFEDGGAFTLGPASGDGAGAFTFGGGGGSRTITVEAPADFCFNVVAIGPYTGAGFSFNGEVGDDTLILDVDPQGAIVFQGVDGDDTLVLNVDPQGAITVLGDDGDNDKLVVNVDVTMAAGSRITDVEKVIVSGGRILTVDDTMLDDELEFELSGKLVINQTTGGDDDPLNLSKITKGDGDPTIAVTGFSGSCTISLEAKQEIADTITIRTKSASDAIDVFTTIENFDVGNDKLAFTGKSTVEEVMGMDAGTFAALIAKAGGAGALTANTVYFGAHTDSGTNEKTSFAIMKQDGDAGILAVKLVGVALEGSDTDIFVGADASS